VKNIRIGLRVSVLLLLGSGIAQAQASRTWVSGVGDDANPCSRTAPCKTFAGAISKTAVGGEIDALDPGGFGAVTITKAVTIDGGGGQVASVLVNGTNGILVSAPATDVVTLRNLSINGIGGGTNGIRFLGGKALHIEHCSISNFTNHGIDIEPSAGGQVFVLDTVSRDNAQSGIRSIATVTKVFVAIDKSRFENNAYGVWAGDFSRFAVRDSDASGNNIGFIAQASVGDVVLSIANSTAANNLSTGVQAGGGSTLSVVRLTGVALFSNATNGMVLGQNGSIVSFGNNYNSGVGGPSSSITPQ
jgi:hypothetical protein